ncbi:MAG TPA: hypothetical protein VE990_07200 [Acidimicrobiales bacterium]|nr:hypothetical protein [Acidimicrobiales bacterium]
MSEEKTPLDQALDLFVYAPLGLFISVTEELPSLIEKGRQRMVSQVNTARAVGQMALPQLQQQLAKVVDDVTERLSPPLPRRQEVAPLVVPTPARTTPAPATAAPATPTPAEVTPARAGAAPAAATASPRPRPPVPGDVPTANGNGSAPAPPAGADTAHLSIPGYDTLSAMQVVQRLPGLAPEELEAVRTYEASHRGRKTILNRADQLLSEG